MSGSEPPCSASIACTVSERLATALAAALTTARSNTLAYNPPKRSKAIENGMSSGSVASVMNCPMFCMKPPKEPPRKMPEMIAIGTSRTAAVSRKRPKRAR